MEVEKGKWYFIREGEGPFTYKARCVAAGGEPVFEDGSYHFRCTGGLKVIAEASAPLTLIQKIRGVVGL